MAQKGEKSRIKKRILERKNRSFCRMQSGNGNVKAKDFDKRSNHGPKGEKTKKLNRV